MEQYNSYKHSGVSWNPVIPSAWRAVRVSDISELVNGYPFDSAQFHPSEGFPLIRIRDIANASTETRYLGEPIEQVLVRKGELIIGMDGDFNGALWSGEPALLNQRLCLLRCKDESITRFLAYSLPIPLQIINDLTYSTTVKHLSSLDVKRIRIGLPPEADLLQIVAFLDRETAKADALIAKYERLVELFEEKRTTLITQVVTKGLDSKAPTRKTRFAQLECLPSVWRDYALKQVIRAPLAYGVLKPERDEGSDSVPLIRIVDIGGGLESTDSLLRITREQSQEYKRTVVGVDDVVVSVVGTLGRAFTITKKLAGCNLSRAVARIQPNRTIVRSRFLEYFLNSSVVGGIIDDITTGTAQRVLNLEDLGRFPCPTPPLAEQDQLIAFLDGATAKLSLLRSRCQRAISLLREQRSALISAAVTGQIDVRAWKAEEVRVS